MCLNTGASPLNDRFVCVGSTTPKIAMIDTVVIISTFWHLECLVSTVFDQILQWKDMFCSLNVTTADTGVKFCFCLKGCFAEHSLLLPCPLIILVLGLVWVWLIKRSNLGS